MRVAIEVSGRSTVVVPGRRLSCRALRRAGGLIAGPNDLLFPALADRVAGEPTPSGQLPNEFAWSWSRHRTFEHCQRRFWLQTYESWGGWQKTADEAVRELYIQRRLVTRPQWIGTLVHGAAEWILQEARQGREVGVETVRQRYQRAAERQIEDSERGLYRFNALKYVAFAEHYYGETASRDVWGEAVHEITRQVEGLFDNRVFTRLLEVPERIVEVEELKRMDVAGVPVWVALDVLVDDGAGGLVVIDWKTGRHHTEEGVAAQLGVYGRYVLDRYLGGRRASAGRVKALYANLRVAEHTVWTLDPSWIEQAEAVIRESSSTMRARLRNPKDNRGHIDDFPQQPPGSPACATCSFRRTCER